eukprot:10221218-Alexandrium_andersonii.AAC.1
MAPPRAGVLAQWDLSRVRVFGRRRRSLLGLRKQCMGRRAPQPPWADGRRLPAIPPSPLRAVGRRLPAAPPSRPLTLSQTPGRGR